MRSTVPLFQPSKQKQICLYLEKISHKGLDEKKAIVMLRDSSLPNPFIISDQIESTISEKNRYFRIYFQDVSMNQSAAQFTPSVIYTKGLLQVSDNGEISILNDNFNSESINSICAFNEGKLELSFDLERLEEQNRNKRCKCIIL